MHKGHLCEREAVLPDETGERDGKVVRYRYGRAWVENPRWQCGKTIHRCEPLVDAAVWKRANEALSTREKRGHSDPGNRAMLSGALSCLNCEDTPMYRVKLPSGKRPYFYYRCSSRGTHRSSCGNMVRLELVDAAVNDVMASTFDTPVMRHEIVYGNEAEIEAELERIRFELKHLAARELDWAEEDRERARLREEQKRVAETTVVEDRVELVATGDTYLELWERLSTPERGPWLVEQGFRVTASKERVTVSQGPVTGEARLDAPERMALVRDTERVHWGKCACGCGTDLYGFSGHGRKMYVNSAHQIRANNARAARRRAARNGQAADPQEP